MHAVLFELKNIPDLSLAKYSSLENSGIEGVLDAHLGFLRQFAQKEAVSLHLFYAYDPSPASADGMRMKVFLLFLADDTHRSHLENVSEVVYSSPLCQFFELTGFTASTSAPNSLEETPRQNMFGNPSAVIPAELAVSRIEQSAAFTNIGPMQTCSALSKTTRFVPTAVPFQEFPRGFYAQPEYESREDSRLFSMMTLMEALNEPVCLRVDLFPSHRNVTMRDSVPLRQIKALQNNAGFGKVPDLDAIEQTYDKLLERLEGSPAFNANIFLFSNNPSSGRALLEAISADAIEKGSLTISQYEGGFSISSFLNGNIQITSSDQKTLAYTIQMPEGGRHGLCICDIAAGEFAHADISTVFTLEDCAAFFRLPTLYDGEFVQKRKETAPPPVASDGALYLGVDRTRLPVYFPYSLFPKHAFISGVPGSGKTNAMLHIVSGLVNNDIPVLVLEPAKREYRALANCKVPAMQNIRIFSPGSDSAFPLRINPFEMPIGVTVGHHINRLNEVFTGAFPINDGPLPFLLDRALEAVYKEHGWNSRMRREEDIDLDFPTLSELYEQLEKELDKEKYSSDVQGDVGTAIRMRIGGLLRRELGELFDVPYSTIPPHEWLTTSNLVELEALGTDQANFLTLLLCVLVRETLMVNPRFDSPVRHVLFIEEAHNLIGPDTEAGSRNQGDPKQAATKFIADMLREVRAMKEGIVIADQLPTAIASEVLKNTGLKIALRMTSEDDRELLGGMMTANPVQLEQLAVATPGAALVTYEGLQRPFEVQIAEWLGVQGRPEFVPDRQERSELSISRDDADLRERLIAEESPWYAEVRDNTMGIDIKQMQVSIEKLRKNTHEIEEALISCNNFLKSIKEDRPHLLYEDTDELKDEFYPYEDRIRYELDNAGFENIDSYHEIWVDCYNKVLLRAQSWANLGYDYFKSPETIFNPIYINNLPIQTYPLTTQFVIELRKILESLFCVEDVTANITHYYKGKAPDTKSCQDIASFVEKLIEIEEAML